MMLLNQQLPNQQLEFSQVILGGIIEVLGRANLKSLLEIARLDEPFFEVNSFEESNRELNLVRQALVHSYGISGAQGIAVQAGRSAFGLMIQCYRSRLNIACGEMCLLPVSRRLRLSLDALAKLIGQECHVDIQVNDLRNVWEWRMRLQRSSSIESLQPGLCQFTMGALQELFAWTSDGDYHQMVEKGCVHQGGSECLIQIDKKALD
jgi:hypothetical protein